MKIELREAFEALHSAGVELSVISFELEIPMFVAQLFAKNIEFDPENFIDDPRPRPDAPTNAPAGSPEKIEVLRQRASKGVELWHPLDSLEIVSDLSITESVEDDEDDVDGFDANMHYPAGRPPRPKGN